MGVKYFHKTNKKNKYKALWILISEQCSTSVHSYGSSCKIHILAYSYSHEHGFAEKYNNVER